MAGVYLRKAHDDDPMRDPTMTYMSDPHAVKVGDYLLGDYGAYRVIALDDAALGNPDIRYATIVDEPRTPPRSATVHDVRPA